MAEITPITPYAPVGQVQENLPGREDLFLQLPADKIVRATVVEGGEQRIMLELGQRRFMVETKVPLQTGQKIDLQVISTSPRIELRIVQGSTPAGQGATLQVLDSHTTGTTPAARPPAPGKAAPDITPARGERSLHLPLDKIVQATVAEGGEKKILLELGQRRFVAETKVPLQTGQKLDLLVLSTSPKIELQIVQSSTAASQGATLQVLDTRTAGTTPAATSQDPASATPDTLPVRVARYLQLPLDKIVQATVAEGGERRVTLELGPHRFVVETKVPLQTGQKLDLLVISTSPKIELQIVQGALARPGATLQILDSRMNEITPAAPHAPISSTPETLPAREDRYLQLPLDKIVRATVAEGGQERIMLELGQRRFVAETKVPLQTGQKLDLLVVSTSPRIELQIVEDPLRGRLGPTLHLLDSRWDFQPLAEQLATESRSIFDRLSPAAQRAFSAWQEVQQMIFTSRGGDELRFLARHLGLDLESRLARGEKDANTTLKSALLEVHRMVQGQEGDLPDKTAQSLQQLELFQLCQAKLAQQQIQMLPLPLPFLEQGYLIAGQGKPSKSGEEGQPFTLSLHLALQGLGNLQVDFLHDAQGVYIRFVCADREKADFAATFGQELTANLADLPLQGITFAAGAPDPARALVMKMMAGGDGILDTRI